MSAIPPLSDAQLLGLLRRLGLSAAPAPTVSPLAAMTDAQLMRALGANSVSVPAVDGAPAATDAAAQPADCRDAPSDPVPGNVCGQGEPAAPDRASDAISKTLSETQVASGNQRASASAEVRGMRRVSGAPELQGRPGGAGRLPLARQDHQARPLDARLANLRRLLLSGPAVFPLERRPRPSR
jgi:hypothetical protein